ncbi:MAG: hypothetical protein COV66_04345 [Nitrospinae bacterium CG11_big_fil_rev_8_21_14_0_20_45_15]|nr:MAG: hypothetical protein COV66_04345 [Nitrospinae bacterium CG11_big_fil_rev_8_21_14_0_20_45_15]
MKRKAILAIVAVGSMIFASSASADELLPGAYAQRDASVMGVSKTMVEIGARDRVLTNAVNLASRADMSRSNASGPINIDYQFGSSQQDQSWKSATLNRSIEEGRVVGLIPGDCRGDNSDDKYRQMMNQNRDGYTPEPLVSNAQCAEDHPTLK